MPPTLEDEFSDAMAEMDEAGGESLILVDPDNDRKWPVTATVSELQAGREFTERTASTNKIRVAHVVISRIGNPVFCAHLASLGEIVIPTGWEVEWKGQVIRVTDPQSDGISFSFTFQQYIS